MKTLRGTNHHTAVRGMATSLMVLAAIALAGCTAEDSGSQSATPAVTPSPSAAAEVPTATPTPTPTDVTLESLHQQYIASGLPCDWVVTESVVRGSVTSGSCRDTEVGISTFAAQSDVEALLKLNTDSIEPGIFLVGDRWVVGSEHPEDLTTAQATMGGQLWPEGSPFFDPNYVSGSG